MLDNALDCGISELEFWAMTFAELDRMVESKQRQRKMEAKQNATNIYSLSALIGRSVAAIMDKNTTFPELYEVFPELFADEIAAEEQVKQERINELSALRFKQFATFHNQKFQEVAKDI